MSEIKREVGAVYYVFANGDVHDPKYYSEDDVEDAGGPHDLATKLSRRNKTKLYAHRIEIVAGGDFLDYHKYIKSEEWREKADAAKERAGHRCQVCNSPDKLNAHHRTYKNLGDEKPEDITVLCERCHLLFHENGKLARDNRPVEPEPSFRKPPTAKREPVRITKDAYLSEETQMMKDAWEQIIKAMSANDRNAGPMLATATPLAVTSTGWLVLGFDYPVLRDKMADYLTNGFADPLARETKKLVGMELKAEPVVTSEVDLP